MLKPASGIMTRFNPQVVDETIMFIKRELMSAKGGFYSALDADSEGVEGKFYTFTKAEIEDILGDDAALFCIYYHVTDAGNWEEEATNVFFRRGSDDQLAEKLGLPVNEMLRRLNPYRQKVFEVRSQRVRPGLDYKILASWNGLMLKGLCDAYRALNIPEYLDMALKNAEFILDKLVSDDGRLKRVANLPPPENNTKKAPKTIEFSENSRENGVFLDDYANVIEAFTALYEVTFDEKWLNYAKKLTNWAIIHYFDEEKAMFFFTADDDEQLIARKSEIMDGVIPSSNSVMARNLKKLGLLFDEQRYLDIAAGALRNVVPQIAKYGSSYSNWVMLLLDEVFGTYEIAITGEGAETLRLEMEKKYIPNKIMLGGKTGSLPLLQDKFGDEARIFICKDKTCGLPATNSGRCVKTNLELNTYKKNSIE